MCAALRMYYSYLKLLGGHEFCWLCFKPWAEHSSVGGGNYKCNSFATIDQLESKVDNNLQKDKSALEKYIFYSIRFEAHEKAEMLALEKLDLLFIIENVSLKIKLCSLYEIMD